MTEEQKIRVATFRFGIICELVNGTKLDYGEKERLIQEKCAIQWTIPLSDRTSISRSTILDWVKKYRDSGGNLESLYPKTRADNGISRSIDDDIAAAIIQLKTKNPKIPIAGLINETVQRNPGVAVKDLPPSCVYRLLKSQGLTGKAGNPPKDRRKFEAENPNDLWQSDVMHGPKLIHKGKYRKSYLVAIIDDHSRLIPHACFCFSENLATYLKVLEQAFLKRGLPRKLYVDNGAAFKSHHLKFVAATLEIALINAKPYQPQGKGKIERWFKTVRSSFLPTFIGETIEHINTSFESWLNTIYHQKKHTATGQTPFNRFVSSMECIRTAPANLTDYFRKTARRKVGKDRTVTLNGNLFEAPVCLIGERVDLLYHEDTPLEVEIKFKQKSYGLIIPVNLNVNCRVKRHKWREDDIQLESNKNDYKGGHLFER